ETGSSKIIVRTIITITKIIAKQQNIIPVTAAINNGMVENATIPSILYSSNFQNDHLVSPATLFTFSYSNHFVLKPTHPNNPLENLLYSFNSSNALTNFLFINR